jgi:hypothetical protein
MARGKGSGKGGQGGGGQGPKTGPDLSHQTQKGASGPKSTRVVPRPK